MGPLRSVVQLYEEAPNAYGRYCAIVAEDDFDWREKCLVLLEPAALRAHDVTHRSGTSLVMGLLLYGLGYDTKWGLPFWDPSDSL